MINYTFLPFFEACGQWLIRPYLIDYMFHGFGGSINFFSPFQKKKEKKKVCGGDVEMRMRTSV